MEVSMEAFNKAHRDVRPHAGRDDADWYVYLPAYGQISAVKTWTAARQLSDALALWHVVGHVLTQPPAGLELTEVHPRALLIGVRVESRVVT